MQTADEEQKASRKLYVLTDKIKIVQKLFDGNSNQSLVIAIKIFL